MAEARELLEQECFCSIPYYHCRCDALLFQDVLLVVIAGLEVIKLEFIFKIKRNDWLLACPQAANHFALF